MVWMAIKSRRKTPEKLFFANLCFTKTKISAFKRFLWSGRITRSKKQNKPFRKEQKNLIQDISKNLVFYEAQLDSSQKEETEKGQPPKNGQNLSQKEISQITAIISNLQKKFQYTREGAISILKYVIKERY